MTKNDWIPISERLPETNKEVLALDERGLCHVAGHYPDGNWYQRWIGLVWRTVTHWTPIPELPSESE